MSLENLSPQERAYLNAGKALLDNPDVARDAKRLLIKAAPGTKFADIELEDRISVREAELKKQADALEERLNKDSLERKIEGERQKIRDAGGDVAAVEAFMKENELYSYDKAWKIFQKVNVPADPTPSSLIHEMKGADAKEIWKNPTEWARTEAKRALDEMRGRAA